MFFFLVFSYYCSPERWKLHSCKNVHENDENIQHKMILIMFPCKARWILHAIKSQMRKISFEKRKIKKISWKTIIYASKNHHEIFSGRKKNILRNIYDIVSICSVYYFVLNLFRSVYFVSSFIRLDCVNLCNIKLVFGWVQKHTHKTHWYTIYSVGGMKNEEKKMRKKKSQSMKKWFFKWENVFH